MKYRSDFVTKSSSSSYVIAVKSDITEEILRALITKEFMLKNLSFSRNIDTETKIDQKCKEYFDDIVKLVITKNHDYFNTPLKVDGWDIHFYNDAEGDEGYASYILLDALKCDYIKSKRYGG